MSQRLTTKWLCYMLALSAGPFWNPVRSVTVQSPPSNPTTVQAQAKFFQDFFSVQLSPYKIEFGHVCEDPHNWEQRYEKKDFKNHRDMGKVRWGDKKGGYGEHYWDLNHAGKGGNHGDYGYDGDSDDGSYHDKESPSDHYDDGPSDHSSYTNDEYNPETSSYEENGRKKRAQPRAKTERKPQKEYNDEDSDQKPTLIKQKGKKVEQLEAAPSHKVEDYSEEDDEPEPEVYKKVPKKRQQQPYREHQNQDKTEQQDNQPKEEKNQVVLVVKEKDDAPEQNQNQYTQQHQQPELNQYGNYESGVGVRQQQYTLQQQQPKLNQYVNYEGGVGVRQQQYTQQQQQPELKQYVNYEGGAGVRQHQQPEVSASAPAPRLFLEHSTGRVVDRATGQAYILQPILSNIY